MCGAAFYSIDYMAPELHSMSLDIISCSQIQHPKGILEVYRHAVSRDKPGLLTKRTANRTYDKLSPASIYHWKVIKRWSPHGCLLGKVVSS